MTREPVDASPETRPRCLRCKSEELAPLDSPQGIMFFECPRCRRQFTQAADGALCFRWRHPITLLLYPVIFAVHPAEDCERVSSIFLKEQTNEAVHVALEELRLELDDPTQQLRETVGCRAPEDEVRAFLRCVAERLEAERIRG
jgi:hypothetical protein